jgi:Kef-type K+ transport system membrane component KefB
MTLQVYSDDAALVFNDIAVWFLLSILRNSVNNCHCVLSNIVSVISYILKKSTTGEGLPPWFCTFSHS